MPFFMAARRVRMQDLILVKKQYDGQKDGS